MPFATLVHQLECELTGYYKLDKQLYDECINGLPSYTNCLLCGIDVATGKRELAYFLPQGETFDKKQIIELFHQPYHFELIFFDATINGIPVFGLPGIKGFKISSVDRLSSFCSLVSFE